MKKRLYAVAMLGALAAAGCTDDDPENPGNNPPPASASEEATLKLVCGTSDNEFGSIAPTRWKEGDAAGVFTAETTNAKFTLGSGAETTAGEFTGKVTGKPDTYYVYVPYKENAVMTGGKIGVPLPATQRYAAGGILPEYFIRVGYAAGKEIQMRNLSGVLAVKVIAPFDLTVTGLSFRTAAGQFAAGRADVEMNYGDGAPAVEIMGNRTRTVTLSLPSEGVAVRAGEPVAFYLALAPDEYAGSTVTVTAQDEDPVILSLPVVAVTSESVTTIEAVYQPKAEPKPDGTDLNDPARYGIGSPDPVYANCYTVSQAGSYFLAATVIGNGQSGVLPDGNFHASTAFIAPVSAALVWEDAQGLVTDVRLSEGGTYLRLEAGAGPGNAVVAVYDGENGSGNILWSWHIWLTETPQDQQYKTPGGTDTYAVMDRNLGAKYCPADNDAITAMTEDQKFAAYGLCYQWGRKDPFPGAAEISGLKEAPIYGQFTQVARTAYDATDDRANNNLLYAVRNPISFITYNTQTSGWTYEQNNYLWGNPQGYGDGGGNYPKGVKTIYDPCPAGYMTAPADVWLASDFEANYSGKFAYGWAFIYDGTNRTWYPGAGLRWEDDGAVGDVGSGGSYWTNSPGSETDKAAIDFFCYRGSTNIINLDRYNRAGGLSVRCVRE